MLGRSGDPLFEREIELHWLEVLRDESGTGTVWTRLGRIRGGRELRKRLIRLRNTIQTPPAHVGMMAACGVQSPALPPRFRYQQTIPPNQRISGVLRVPYLLTELQKITKPRNALRATLPSILFLQYAGRIRLPSFQYTGSFWPKRCPAVLRATLLIPHFVFRVLNE